MGLSVRGRRVCATVTTTALMALAFSSAAAARPDVSRDLITPGTLLVGSDIPFPPFEFGTPPRYKGFDIDMVNAMARKLQLRVKYVDTDFDTIFNSVGRGKFDLVAAAATITPERRKVVAFSRPYYDAQQSLIVKRGSGIRSVRGLAGRTVSAQWSTSGEWFARNETRAAKVIGFSTGPAAVRAVNTGRAAAAVVDSVFATYSLKSKWTGLRVARNISVGERYGFAMSKDSIRLRKGINWAFNRIRADDTFKRLYRKWFGMAPPPSLRR